MNKPLWQPSEKLKENSLLRDFCKFINFQSSFNFKEIWRWSIDNPNEFWSKFWDYSKIIGDKGSEIIKKDKSVKGFNLGTNIGKVSGQSIFHCHFHLIPRREGDVDNPQGGVRSVIPNKQHYKRNN